MTELTIADIDKTIIMTKNRLTDALNKNVSADAENTRRIEFLETQLKKLQLLRNDLLNSIKNVTPDIKIVEVTKDIDLECLKEDINTLLSKKYTLEVSEISANDSGVISLKFSPLNK